MGPQSWTFSSRSSCPHRAEPCTLPRATCASACQTSPCTLASRSSMRMPSRPTSLPQRLRNLAAITPCTEFLFFLSQPSLLSKILLVSCFLNCMDSQGPLWDVGSSNPNDVSTTNPPAGGSEFRIQRGSIHFSGVFHLLGVKCRFYFRTPSCLQFQGWGLHLRLKVDLAPPSTSRQGLKSEVPRNVSWTHPSPAINEEVFGKNQKLLNWMTWRTKWSSWRLVGIGRITGSSSWLPFGERCTVLSLHHRNKVMFVFFPSYFSGHIRHLQPRMCNIIVLVVHIAFRG